MSYNKIIYDYKICYSIVVITHESDGPIMKGKRGGVA